MIIIYRTYIVKDGEGLYQTLYSSGDQWFLTFGEERKLLPVNREYAAELLIS